MKHHYTDDASRESFGPCPDIQQVKKIVRHATNCQAIGDSRESWNGRVNTAVLDLAFDNDVYIGKLGFSDW